MRSFSRKVSRWELMASRERAGGVQGVDAVKGPGARVGLPPGEADQLAQKAGAVAADEEAAVPDAGMGVDHHAHVDVVQQALPQELLFAAEEADLPLLLQPLPVLQLHVFLRRHGHEGHVPVQLVRQGCQAHGGAQHGGDLGVVAAGVGGACLPVRLGVQGADHRVQLSHHHDPGAGRTALQIAPDAGDGQMVPERDPELRKGAAHQLRRPPLLEAQLRVGEDLLADPDDGVLMFIDGLETLRFQRLFRHMKTSLRSILPIAAETHGCLSIFYIKCENLQGFVDRRGNMGYDKPVQKVVSLRRRPCAAWS